MTNVRAEHYVATYGRHAEHLDADYSSGRWHWYQYRATLPYNGRWHTIVGHAVKIDGEPRHWQGYMRRQWHVIGDLVTMRYVFQPGDADPVGNLKRWAPTLPLS